MAAGIIFGDYLLTYDQFEPIFIEWYTQKKNDFATALQTEIIEPVQRMVKIDEISNKVMSSHGTAIKIKGEYDANAIYSAWEHISLEYFGNSPVTLIVGAKFGESSFQWTNILNEKDVVNEKGINVRKKGLQKLQEQMQDNQAVFAAANIQNIINQHYESLLTQLDSYTLSKDEAIAMHQLLAARGSALNRPGFTGSTYNQIVFGSQRNASGKQLDAFMNHMGDLHAQVFSLMSQGIIPAESLSDMTLEVEDDFPSIFQNTDQVQPWLVDSLNSASWLTGGDIVVVNSKGAVIYNIQLKTTSRGKTFDVAVSSLYEFATKMLALINEDATPQELAQLMFKKLQTTSANDIDNTEKFYEEKIYELVEKNLKLR